MVILRYTTLICAPLLLVALLFISSCDNKVQFPVGNSLGPSYGGRIVGIAVDKQNPDKLAICSPGGGVYVTSDNGQNWKDLWYKLDDPNVYDIAFDLYNPARLYAATPSTLFYVDNPFDPNTNPEWKVLAGGYGLGQVPSNPYPYSHENGNSFMQIDLGNQQRAILWARQGGALYYSFDGTTFASNSPFGVSAPDPKAFIQALGIDAKNRVFFATQPVFGSPAQIWRSTAPWFHNQPSLNWQQMSNGLPQNINAIDFEPVPGSNKTALFYQINTSAHHIAFFDEPTSTWGSNPATLPVVSWAATTIKSHGKNKWLAGTVEFYESTDNGATWFDHSSAGMHTDTRAIVVQAYPLRRKTYVWNATDGFRQFPPYAGNLLRWEISTAGTLSNPVNIPTTGVTFWQAFNILPLQRSSNQMRYLTGSLDNGAMCLDQGQAWTSTSGGTGCSDVVCMVAAPSDPNRVYMRTCSRQFAVSNNAQTASSCQQVQWQTMNANEQENLGTPLIWTNGATSVLPSDKDVVFFATRTTVATSENGGQTWRHSQLPGNEKPISVFATDTVIYAGGNEGGFYQSKDRALSWQSTGLKNTSLGFITNVALSTHANGSIYVTSEDGLYRRQGSGNWQRLTIAGLPTFDVVVNPVCNNFVWVSFGIQEHTNQKGQILVSNDHGDTWRILYNNGSPVSDLHITGDANKLTLGIATFGRGVSQTAITTDCGQP